MRRLKILVPFDFSRSSHAAFEASLLLACGSHGKVPAAHMTAAEALTSGFEDLFPSSEL